MIALMPTRVWLALGLVVGCFCIALVKRRSFVVILAALLPVSCAHVPPPSPPAPAATPSPRVPPGVLRAAL